MYALGNRVLCFALVGLFGSAAGDGGEALQVDGYSGPFRGQLVRPVTLKRAP